MAHPATALQLATRLRKLVAETQIDALTEPTVQLSDTPSLLLLLASETLCERIYSLKSELSPGITGVFLLEAGELPVPSCDDLTDLVVAGIETRAADNHRAALEVFAKQVGMQCEPGDGGLMLVAADCTVHVTFDDEGRMLSINRVRTEPEEAERQAATARMVEDFEFDDESPFGPSPFVFAPTPMTSPMSAPEPEPSSDDDEPAFTSTGMFTTVDTPSAASEAVIPSAASSSQPEAENSPEAPAPRENPNAATESETVIFPPLPPQQSPKLANYPVPGAQAWNQPAQPPVAPPQPPPLPPRPRFEGGQPSPNMPPQPAPLPPTGAMPGLPAQPGPPVSNQPGVHQPGIGQPGNWPQPVPPQPGAPGQWQQPQQQGWTPNAPQPNPYGAPATPPPPQPGPTGKRLGGMQPGPLPNQPAPQPGMAPGPQQQWRQSGNPGQLPPAPQQGGYPGGQPAQNMPQPMPPSQPGWPQPGYPGQTQPPPQGQPPQPQFPGQHRPPGPQGQPFPQQELGAHGAPQAPGPQTGQFLPPGHFPPVQQPGRFPPPGPGGQLPPRGNQ